MFATGRCSRIAAREARCGDEWRLDVTVRTGDRDDVVDGVSYAALGKGDDTGKAEVNGDPLESGTRLDGDDGADVLTGGAGQDLLRGGDGDDRLATGDDDNFGDNLFGGSGRDRVAGGPGGDILKGDSGRDRVSGGAGNDELSGNSGATESGATRDGTGCSAAAGTT